MLPKPLMGLLGALGSGALLAMEPATLLVGEAGPPGEPPDTAALVTVAALQALLDEVEALVTTDEAAETFVLPSQLPDLSDKVPLAELDLSGYLTEEALAEGYVPAGQVPDLALWLSATEAASLYLPKSAIPSADDLVTAADLPDTSLYPTAVELAATTFTKDQLAEKFVTKADALAFVPLGELPDGVKAEVQALIAARIAALKCPPNMLHVADFCIDLVEASVWTTPCGQGGAQLGVTEDDYGAGFPDAGSFTEPRYACPVVGVKPSRFITWFQAQQACALSGKRLCTDAEWQLAALGTPDGACATGGTDVVATASKGGCKSDLGARDMVGNAREMVAELRQGGPYWKNNNGDATTDWPAGYGDGQDAVRGVNGTTSEPQKAGLPAMTVRGGAFGDGEGAGAFAIALDAAPTHADQRTGFRCCRSMR